jgi:hypothetical protein
MALSLEQAIIKFLIFFMMKKFVLNAIIIFTATFVFAQNSKAPAYPLITHDPYFSIWSTTDELAASPTKHWTGTDHSLIGLLKVDSTIYRFLGNSSKVYKTIVPAADEVNYTAAYTEGDPGQGWMNTNFNDGQWKKGVAPFGDDKILSKTMWLTKDLWVRREITINNTNLNDLFLKLQHDDDVEVYLNGEQVYKTKGYAGKFIYLPISDQIKSVLKKGKNLLALHVTNTGGGAWLDAGIVEEQKETKNEAIKTAVQNKLTLNATQTGYEFTCGKVDLLLTFTSPLLINDLNILSRPVSYISANLKSNDGASHDVQLYFGASTDIAANTTSQEMNASRYLANGLAILKAGTRAQPVLQKKGDDLRIDWGYMYVAVPAGAAVKQNVSSGNESFKAFEPVETNLPRGKHLVLNTNIKMGKIGITAKEQIILIGYDDLYSVQYFGKNLQPWWRLKPAATIEHELALAAKDYTAVIKKCTALNKMIYDDAVKAGGDNYAKICELAYRQSIAAHTLVQSPREKFFFFPKKIIAMDPSIQ